MTKRSKIVDLASSMLIAAMLGTSLSMVASSSLGLSIAPTTLLGLCASVCALLAIASISRRFAVLAFLLACGGSFFLYTRGIHPIQDIRAFVQTLFSGSGELSLTEYSITFGGLLAVILSLLFYWMTRMTGGVYPALTLAIIILLGGWFFEHRLDAVSVVPTVAALVCMFSRASDNRVAYLRVLPVAAIVAALAFILTPPGNITWPPLEEGAAKVRQLFYDYFMFTEPRTAYSLYGDGYLPLGDRLGGPANPHDQPVMFVETDQALFLRGSVKRTYTGYSWTDNSVNNRYLWGDITKRTTRDAVFDVGRITGLEGANLFRSTPAKITMQSNATSTLFVPHRVSDLSTAFDLVPYYNNSGEVFTTRGLTFGDTYTLQAEAPMAGASAMEQLIREAAAREDANYESFVSNYTNLPRGVEENVFWLTQSVIEGAKTPYEKALRIQEYLLNNYEYTLDVEYPPRNRDFVSHFLLTQKQGYCTYFASAMAVMARMAELPSRYIEGYVAIPDSNGSGLITGQNAHAWVEIYFKGIGWVTFNPTPGFGDMTRDTQPPPEAANEGEAPPGNGNDENAEEDEGEGEDELRPEETPPPEDDPSGSDDEQPPEDEETPPEETPTPPPENPEEPEEDSSSEEEPRQRSRSWLIWLIAILLALAVGSWIFYRIRISDPAVRAARFEDDGDKLIVWYKALLLLLQQQGQAPEANESPVMYAERLKTQGIVDESFVFVAGEVSLSRYAPAKKPDPAVFPSAAAAYAQLKKQLKPGEHMHFYVTRITRGLGDLDHIP